MGHLGRASAGSTAVLSASPSVQSPHHLLLCLGATTALMAPPAVVD